MSLALFDPYCTLQIPPTAKRCDVKRAYRQLAKQCHPDLNHGDGHKMHEINRAYALLMDSSLRRSYDRGEIDAFGQPTDPDKHSRNNASRKAQNKNGGTNGTKNGTKNWTKNRTKNQTKNQTRKRQQPTEPNTVLISLSIPLALALTGGKRQIRLSQRRRIAVEIPCGIQSGQILRLGQLIPPTRVEVFVEPDLFLTVNKRDLNTTVSIGQSDLGTRVPILLPHRQLRVRIPPHLASGQILRLRGCGFPALKTPFGRHQPAGDLYLTVFIAPSVADTVADSVSTSISSSVSSSVSTSSGGVAELYSERLHGS